MKTICNSINLELTSFAVFLTCAHCTLAYAGHSVSIPDPK